MIIKTYGIYDTAGKEFISTFTSKNDKTAERAAKYIVRDKGFDRIAGKDYVIQHVFDFDNETGVVIDNSVCLITALATEVDLVIAEEKEHRDQMMALQAQIPTQEEKKDA